MNPLTCQILLIEDERDQRVLLCELLEHEGFRVRTASNGLEGLELLAAWEAPPGLILLDLLMPVMNGWSFLEAVQERGLLESIPVVVITAMTGQSVPLASGSLGKPIDISKLLACARRYCGAQEVAPATM
jgi:CheY-like chemotaxis protein